MASNSNKSSDQSSYQSSEPPANNHQPLHQLQCLNDTLQNLQRRLADLESSSLNQLTALPPTPRDEANAHCPSVETYLGVIL